MNQILIKSTFCEFRLMASWMLFFTFGTYDVLNYFSMIFHEQGRPFDSWSFHVHQKYIISKLRMVLVFFKNK